MYSNCINLCLCLFPFSRLFPSSADSSTDIKHQCRDTSVFAGAAAGRSRSFPRDPLKVTTNLNSGEIANCTKLNVKTFFGSRPNSAVFFFEWYSFRSLFCIAPIVRNTLRFGRFFLSSEFPIRSFLCTRVAMDLRSGSLSSPGLSGSHVYFRMPKIIRSESAKRVCITISSRFDTL